MPYITPLAINLLETPNLIGRPPIVYALRQSLHMLPLHIVKPGLQEVVLVNILQLDPPTPALHFSKYLIFMIPPGVVKSALFRRAANAAGSYLRDVDVGVFFRGVVDVFVDGEGDGGIRYGFAEEPGYALLVARSDGKVVAMKGVEEGYQLKDTVIIIGQGFVLRAGQYGRR